MQIVGYGSLTSFEIGEVWYMRSVSGSEGSYCVPRGFSDGIIILLLVLLRLFMLSSSVAGTLLTTFVSTVQLRGFGPGVGAGSFGS